MQHHLIADAGDGEMAGAGVEGNDMVADDMAIVPALLFGA